MSEDDGRPSLITRRRAAAIPYIISVAFRVVSTKLSPRSSKFISTVTLWTAMAPSPQDLRRGSTTRSAAWPPLPP